MKKVLINTTFDDVYTGERYQAGSYENMTEERIAEIKSVDPNFVTIVGNAESNTGSAPTTPEVEQTGTTEPEHVDKALEDMTKKELIELGKEYELDLNDSMTKKVMIEAIEGAMNLATTPEVEQTGTTEPETEPTDSKPSADDLIDELDGTEEEIEDI